MHLHNHPFTLRQLQYACAVAEALHFRRAAERVGVSQPSLSKQLAALEDALGVRLFERDRRGVRLTAEGEALIPQARAILCSVEELVHAARSLDPFEGVMRIGIIPTIAPYLLPDLDPALRARFPKLELRWREEKTARLVPLVEGGELDAALVALESDLGGLEHEVIGRDAFVLAAPRAHQLAAEEGPITRDALTAHELLLLDDGHCFRDQALDLCAVSGASEASFRATSLTTLVQMASGGAHATLLPSMAVDVENRRGRLCIRCFADEDAAPGRTLALVWRRGSSLAGPLRTLARAMADAWQAARAC